jgi:hypothetical protein
MGTAVGKPIVAVFKAEVSDEDCVDAWRAAVFPGSDPLPRPIGENSKPRSWDAKIKSTSRSPSPSAWSIWSRSFPWPGFDLAIRAIAGCS